MATIGVAGKWMLYIVKKEDDPPTVSTKYTDYSDYVLDFSTKGIINELKTFEGTFVNINTTTKRGEGLAVTTATLDKGNLIYLLAGTKLVGKFVINKPVIGTDYTVKISGVQSSGTAKLNRKLANENMPKITYDNAPFCDILKCTTNNAEGILVDSSENTILCLSPTYSGGTDKHSADFKYENRITAVDEVTNLSGQEWWIDHGTNDTTPYSEGDVLCIDDRQGTDVSSKTFYVQGANMNASISEGAEELETNINHILLEGQSQTGEQITAETFDATGNYSCITSGKAIDGWLSADISDGSSDPGCTYIPVTSDSFGGLMTEGCGGGGICGFWGNKATGCYIELRIDNERILAGCLAGTPPCFTSLCRVCATTATEATPHKKGADVMLFSERWPGEVPFRAYVDCVNCFAHEDGHRVRIGSEWFYKCCYAGSIHGANFINILRSGSGKWQCAYSHGDRVLVRDEYWDPSCPDNRIDFAALSGFSVGECITGGTSASTGVVTAGCIACNFVNLCTISNNFTNGECVVGSVSGCMGDLCKGYTTNSIMQCGLFSKTLSDNTAKNWHMLDLNAQRMLLTKKLPIKRIVLEIADAYNVWSAVNLGDTVTLGDGSELGFTDGETVRVTGFEFAFEGGFDRLVLYCNDKDTRTYASSELNYSQEKIQSEMSRQQDPLLNFTKCAQASIDCGAAGCPAIWEQGWKVVKGVMSPEEDFDATNKKYVDAAIAASGGYWTCCGSLKYLKPCIACYNVLPCLGGEEAGSDSFLGTSSCKWGAVHGVYICGNAFYGNGEYVSCVMGVIKADNGNCVYPGNLVGICERGICIVGCNGICTCRDPADPIGDTLIIDGGGAGNLWANGLDPYICPCSGCSICTTNSYIVNWTCSCRLCIMGCIRLPVGVDCY
jgi:hypothetical protein